jgi:hypothetical protein
VGLSSVIPFTDQWTWGFDDLGSSHDFANAWDEPHSETLLLAHWHTRVNSITVGLGQTSVPRPTNSTQCVAVLIQLFLNP